MNVQILKAYVYDGSGAISITEEDVMTYGSGIISIVLQEIFPRDDYFEVHGIDKFDEEILDDIGSSPIIFHLAKDSINTEYREWTFTTLKDELNVAMHYDIYRFANFYNKPEEPSKDQVENILSTYG